MPCEARTPVPLASGCSAGGFGDGGADGPAAGPAWSALAEWCDSDKILAEVLVDNPETLYRLPPWPAEDASAAPSES